MRKRGIFGQLFALVTVVMMVSFLMIGTFLYTFLGSHLTKQQVNDLTGIANRIVKFTVDLNKVQPDILKQTYQANIDVIAAATQTTILIVNGEGDTVVVSGAESDFSIKREFINGILKGNTVKYTGTLGGLFNTTMLTVGVPMQTKDGVFGGVLMSLPVPEIDELRSTIITRFGLIAAIVFVFVVLFTYLISKRITNPIKKLNNAAKSIAMGEFEKRVELENDDEIGQLCETFNYMAGAIERHESARSSFLANIAHELRTPMTTITGFVEGIIDGTIPEEKHSQFLSIVLDESKRLSRLINDLMDMNKLEQGKYIPEMREFDINEMIRLQIIKMEKRITDKNISLTVNFESESQRVIADKDSIQRVVINLFDNAVKFTQENGFMDIRTGTANGKAYVSVQNSGAGIEKEDLEHIFDRFYKSDKSRSLDKTGVGLGLYIVKSIIMAHREKIWAESEPGEFTRFNFTLPLAHTK
ncbi:MAG: HAMP domain-containing histidine kinase [Ruminococcaceae bacterium]|nr:HAMP domain-containing histidine kinase [Oscillospiraceae bacterium]